MRYLRDKFGRSSIYSFCLQFVTSYVLAHYHSFDFPVLSCCCEDGIDSGFHQFFTKPKYHRFKESFMLGSECEFRFGLIQCLVYRVGQKK